MSLNDYQPHNRSTSASHVLTTPFQPQRPMTQQKSHSSMFEKVSEAKRLSGYQPDDFYTDEDVRNHSPTGWPLIAAKQMYHKSHDSFRLFRPLLNLVLTSYAQKIWSIENKLDEINFDLEKAEGRPLGLFPFNREQFIARCLQGTGHLSSTLPKSSENTLDFETQKDNLVANASILMREYLPLLMLKHEAKKLHQVSRSAHEQNFKEAQLQGLDDEALAFMRYMDDFITTEPDYISRKFESLLYMSPTRIANLLKRFCCFFSGDSLPTDSGAEDPRLVYSLPLFEVLFKALLVLALLALLITPVSILYLAIGWSRGQYLAVVIVSSTLFACVMAMFETRTAHLLVGISTFFAVLVTFLSNINSCGTV